MNSLESSQTFEAARRQHLIDATIEALADVGFKATSLSQIARRADVSTGLFAHYFGDKDGLLEATLRFMAARLVRATRQRLRAATTPRERLYAVPDSALADQEFERRTSAVWLAFWGQITHSIRYQRIQRIYQRRMLSNLRHDLRALVPAHCVEDYATMIASMIDGVWIRSHASATQADGSQARAIVRALIDGLIAGAPRARQEHTLSPPVAPPIRVAAATARRMDIISPVTGEKLGCFLAARHEEVGAAVAKAKRGLEVWRLMSGYSREKALRRCADLLRLEGQHLAHLDALSMGRAVSQTLESSVPRAARAFERMSAWASHPTNVQVALGAGSFGDTRRESLGLVAGFGHWSSPLLYASHQAAAALACGNAMIFQPSEMAGSSALHLGDIMARAGVPGDVFTIVNGDAQTALLLLSHPELIQIPPCPDAADRSLRAQVPKAATVIFADADMDRAAVAVLHGCRRWTPTPDLSETLIFVQQSGLAAFRVPSPCRGGGFARGRSARSRDTNRHARLGSAPASGSRLDRRCCQYRCDSAHGGPRDPRQHNHLGADRAGRLHGRDGHHASQRVCADRHAPRLRERRRDHATHRGSGPGGSRWNLLRRLHAGPADCEPTSPLVLLHQRFRPAA